MNDQEAAAFVAALAENEMTRMIGGSSIKHNRTNWRHILAGKNNQQGFSHGDQNPNYAPIRQNPNNNYPPVNNGASYDGIDNIPMDISNQPKLFLPNNIPPHLLGIAPQQTGNPSNLEATSGFEIPNYTNSPKAQESSNEELIAVKDEVKLLKRAINKLIRVVEALSQKIDISKNEVISQS